MHLVAIFSLTLLLLVLLIVICPSNTLLYRALSALPNFLIVSTHVIFWARAPRMVTRPAEGSCFCLATVSVFSLCPGAAQVQETARAREHAARATSPLSRVTAAAFPLPSEYDTASSPARDHACVCVCCVTAYRIPRTSRAQP